MDSTDPPIAILPINLGSAAAFDQNVFPLAYYEGGGNNLSKGSFLIRATLEEMEKIKELGIDLNKNEDFIFNTRLSLEALKAQRTKLQENRKTLNPFKAFLNYRAARLFHTGSRALYLETKRTSEKIHREERVQVVSSKQVQRVNDVPGESTIFGWAIELPDGYTDDAKRTINDATKMIATTDPFQDDTLISQLHDGEQAITLADIASLVSQDVRVSGADEGNQMSVASSELQQSRPTSSQTINHYHIYQNSVVNTNSSLSGFTVNRGSHNSGASV